MGHRVLLLLFVSLCYYVAAVQTGNRVKSPATRFTCQGRASGYYADVETGCQVYHMCDGLGRQFSYSCPNTTLFQQRMLICDHWYMVNCTNSESDYDANLLIGQRDKPFVSESDMRLRTPRPDILSVPPNSKYYDGLKEAESKFPSHPGNSIVGISGTINPKENELDSDKRNYRPPTSWSTGTKRKRPSINKSEIDIDSNTPAINKGKTNVLKTNSVFSSNSNVNRPSQLLEPPFLPSTTESDSGKVKPTSDPVFNFIKRFDPNSSDSIKTAMTKTEIIDLNHHLPEGQISSEEERSPRKNKNFANNLNIVQTSSKNSASEASRFNTVNTKPKIDSNTESSHFQVMPPSKELTPPKFEITPKITTTMGPPIYYEWKWAVPAFDLEPPKLGNESNSTTPRPVKPAQKRPFSVITRSTPKEVEPSPLNTEYNISSYFVPDYVFPLDGPHPGYEDENAQTSFQVNVPRPGRESYGENPACPQCHPAYLNPGTCEPCIVKR